MTHIVKTEEALKTVRKFYNSKKLSAQAGKSECLYIYPEDPDISCAIGCFLPEAFKMQLLQDGRNDVCVYDLSIAGIIQFENPIVAKEFETLQAAHDSWVSWLPTNSTKALDYHAHFLEQLLMMEAKYLNAKATA